MQPAKSNKRGKSTTEIDFSELTRDQVSVRGVPVWFRTLSADEQGHCLKVRSLRGELKRSNRSCLMWLRSKLGRSICSENTWAKFMAGETVTEESLSEYRRSQ